MHEKLRILVVDDDPSIRDLLRAHLSSENYEVVTARDGSEVATRVAETNPHAIIMDINMPNMDGFAVLESLHAVFEIRRLPVLILTARHTQGDVLRAMRLGAKDYLAKPFRKEQLLARVARMLGQAPTVPVAADGKAA